MDEYQIGKDIQSLNDRIERLEARIDESHKKISFRNRQQLTSISCSDWIIVLRVISNIVKVSKESVSNNQGIDIKNDTSGTLSVEIGIIDPNNSSRPGRVVVAPDEEVNVDFNNSSQKEEVLLQTVRSRSCTSVYYPEWYPGTSPPPPGYPITDTWNEDIILSEETLTIDSFGDAVTGTSPRFEYTINPDGNISKIQLTG